MDLTLAILSATRFPPRLFCQFLHHQLSNFIITHKRIIMAPHKVIVFGPTGAVGSAAARTAQEQGAQVVLAMRDTTKAIRGLDAEKEKQGSFERIYADLTKPDTVGEAVNKTGAKYAFMYVAQGTSDHMKSTIQALKNAGIELVVFLSSFTVRGELKAIEPS